MSGVEEIYNNPNPPQEEIQAKPVASTLPGLNSLPGKSSRALHYIITVVVIGVLVALLLFFFRGSIWVATTSPTQTSGGQNAIATNLTGPTVSLSNAAGIFNRTQNLYMQYEGYILFANGTSQLNQKISIYKLGNSIVRYTFLPASGSITKVYSINGTNIYCPFEQDGTTKCVITPFLNYFGLGLLRYNSAITYMGQSKDNIGTCSQFRNVTYLPNGQRLDMIICMDNVYGYIANVTELLNNSPIFSLSIKNFSIGSVSTQDIIPSAQFAISSASCSGKSLELGFMPLPSAGNQAPLFLRINGSTYQNYTLTMPNGTMVDTQNNFNWKDYLLYKLNATFVNALPLNFSGTLCVDSACQTFSCTPK